MNKRITLAVLLSLCTLLPAAGQTIPQRRADETDDVVKITTSLVQIDAVVTKDGKPVSGLTANDFEIYEDGKRQTITSFAYISTASSEPARTPTKDKNRIFVPPAPVKRDVSRRTIAIVVDDLGLSAESMTYVRRSVRQFVAEQLQPNDLVAILRTGKQVGALQQFTNDKRLLNRAVEQLRWNLCSRVGINVLPPVGPTTYSGCHHSYTNTLSQLRAIVDAMGELPGRKSLILMSDSVPIQDQEVQPNEYDVPDWAGANWLSRYALDKIAERAIRSSVVIYAVDTQGVQTTGPTAADQFSGDIHQVLAQMRNVLSTRSHLLQDRRAGGELLARQTGGFQIRNSNAFGLDRIMQDQTGYYLLGYRPNTETFNKRFHHIQAKVKKARVDVRTRFGFYGVSDDEEVKLRVPAAVKATNLALMSPFAAQDLEFELASFFTNDKLQGSFIRSFIYLDPANLSFKQANDSEEASIEIQGIVFGDNGAPVEQVTHRVPLSFTKDEYEKMVREGLRMKFDMPAKKPGSYQVRIAVRDQTSAKIGSAGQFVAVPDLNNKQLALSGIVLQGVSDAAPQNAMMSNPAVRRFPVNANVYFAFVVYNGSSNLSMQTKLFRDGKVVKSSSEIALDVNDQADPTRVLTTSVMRLTPDLEPGNYYLQLLLTDKGASAKQPPAIQWVDFEIVK